jgi:hypothetical protein
MTSAAITITDSITTDSITSDRSARPRTRRRRTLRAVVAATTLAVVALVCIGCSPEQIAAADAANASRQAEGLPALVMSPALSEKAQAWAVELARRQSLSHSVLTDDAPEGWLKLGENVGRGPSIEAIQDGFMASPAHRANVLDPSFNWIGTGVATASDGTIFVVQVFGHY